MASDYGRGLSERRGIRLPRSRPDVPEKPPERAPRQRDMFKALGLTSNPTPVWHQSRALAPAVTRHARIVSAILFARSIGDPLQWSSAPNFGSAAPRSMRSRQTEQMTLKRHSPLIAPDRKSTRLNSSH